MNATLPPPAINQVITKVKPPRDMPPPMEGATPMMCHPHGKCQPPLLALMYGDGWRQPLGPNLLFFVSLFMVNPFVFCPVYRHQSEQYWMLVVCGRVCSTHGQQEAVSCWHCECYALQVAPTHTYWPLTPPPSLPHPPEGIASAFSPDFSARTMTVYFRCTTFIRFLIEP